MDSTTETLNSADGAFRNIKHSIMESGLGNLYNGDGVWSKVVFLIMMLILFVILMRAGIYLITWMMAPKYSPLLVDGLKNAQKPLRVEVNPNISNSTPILRSRNERDGLEFTWTVWININNIDVFGNRQKRLHVFNKGSSMCKVNEKSMGGANSVNECGTYKGNGPGLYIHPKNNELIVVMDTFKKTRDETGAELKEEVSIGDIPINKWMNVAIRVKQKTMDVFINGEAKIRHHLNSIPRQNYGPVFVNLKGGFDGQLSDLWYHNEALTGLKLLEITRAGPNLRSSEKLAKPPYFSQKWFFDNINTRDDDQGAQ
tara:strand:+ start:485 stop:1426 length:942 start_codon:yes stop_codon:yes gene_type:complete